MVSRFDRRPLSVLILALCLGLASCSSDDDPTDPGGGGDGDTTAPTVDMVDPLDGTLMVMNSGSLMVQFDEPMDPIDATGEILMSHGTLVSADWLGDSTLTIEYTGWPQALWVTVALGTGFKDVAGNPLKETHVVGFGTWSDDLALFEMSPADGATDINRSSSIILDFVDSVDQGQVESEITISDGTKADLPFSSSTTNGSTWILDPNDDLPANTQVTVTIGTGLVSDNGVSFPAPYMFSFTTNDQIDVTPPTIVSIEPADGSTIPDTTSEIVFTFSERINPDNFRPTSMNGQLLWLINMAPSEPSWNGAGDVLTVPLPAGLPAGLELEAIFADYEDMAGNVQTEETPWKVAVAGTGFPLPYADGMRYVMTGEWSEGDSGSEIPTDSGTQVDHYRVEARGPADQWNVQEWEDDWTNLRSYDIQRVTSSAIALIGFTEGDGFGLEEIMLGTDAVWAELPLVAGNKWDQEFSVTTPDGTIDVALGGEVIGEGGLIAGEFDGIAVTWTGAWMVRVVLDLSSGGETFTMEIDDNWYVPGVGLVRNVNSEEGEGKWQVSEVWLSLDPGN